MRGFVNRFGSIYVNLHVKHCVLGVDMLVDVWIREWSLSNVRESVCLCANLHLDVWVRERIWLSAPESKCELV